MSNLHYPALLKEAQNLLARREFSRCYHICQQLLAIRKNDPAALLTMAAVDYTGGQRQRAIEQMRRFVRLHPKHVDGRIYFGRLLDEEGRSREAITQYDKALKLDSGNVAAIAGKARALDRGGQPEKAMKLLERRMTSPKGEGLTAAMALVYSTAAMNLKDYDRAVEVAEPHVERRDEDPRSVSGLAYVLGQCHERMDRIQESFRAYALANSIGAPEHDPDQHDRAIDELIELFSKANLDRLPRAEAASEAPVFIACRPRSGSTLIERIIGSHPQAHAAGEINYLHNIAQSMPYDIGSTEPYPRCVLDLDQHDVNTLGTNYIEQLLALNNRARRITNKHLSNWQYLGVVELLMPNARIIDLRRDRIDHSIACYCVDLGSNFPFSYKLEHIARDRLAFERLMEHWHETLSIPMLRVNYEDVVADQETWSRRMIDFLGLEWDDSVLDFHTTAGKKGSDKHTLSYAQVRQPIYKSSVGRAEKFKPFIGELFEALGEPRPTEPRPTEPRP